MAFPQIVSVDCKQGTGNGSSYNANYPDNLVLGDLIIWLHGNRSRSNNTVPGAFVGVTRPQGGGGPSGAQQTSMWGKRVSTGSESGGTFTVSMGTTDNFIWYTLRITGWEGTLGTTFDNSGTAGSVELLYAEGNSSTPDPPNLDPNNWGTKDTLWIAHDVRREATVNLTSYSLGSNQASQVTSDIRSERCSTESTVGSLNPAAFTCSGGDDWMAATIAVQPAPDPPPPVSNPKDFRPQVTQAGGMRW